MFQVDATMTVTRGGDFTSFPESGKSQLAYLKGSLAKLEILSRF